MMDTRELLKKVRKIEIKTKGLSEQIFSGEYHSAFKGRGMAFSEVREYLSGDDIRAIDWNVTARFNHPYIKVFEEERELTVMLLIDLSASSEFGTNKQFKRELIAELSAVIAFSAMKNNDKIGAILFTDKIEKFIPPKKGKSHVLRIVSEIISTEPTQKGTSLNVPLTYLINAIKKRSIAFLISDFISNESFYDVLKIASRKHDLVALEIADQREKSIPNLGLIQIRDNESGKVRWIHTGIPSVRRSFAKKASEQSKMVMQQLQKSGVDHVQILTGENYVKPLMNLFKKRNR